MAAQTWTFGCPQTDSYNFNVDLGLMRTQMDGGLTRQRRRYTHRPHEVNTTITFNTATMSAASVFIQNFGTDWFNMNLVTSNNLTAGAIPHEVRVTDNYTIRALGYDLYELKMKLEIREVSEFSQFVEDCAGIQECLIDAEAAFAPRQDRWTDLNNVWPS